MIGMVQRYRRFLIRKPHQSAGAGGRLIDFQGQGFLWMMPIASIGLLDYCFHLPGPYRFGLLIVAGLISLAGLLFALVTLLIEGAKIDLARRDAALRQDRH